jgi:hypothetical protein
MTTIATRYGGALFLLNVLLALEIYGDFTRPLFRLVNASPWHLLDRLARNLLGDAGSDDDPLWRLLADLAPTPADAAGEDWPREWRCPDAWLHAFAPHHDWTWCVRSGRLRVRHPAGFLVFDLPAQPDVAQQLRSEMTEYGPHTLSSQPDDDPLHWPDLLAQLVRARVHAALAANTPEFSASMLLRLPATVHVTETHFDLTASLEDLPIEVRMAGLDRDPGWVPAAARFVAFHFE